MPSLISDELIQDLNHQSQRSTIFFFSAELFWAHISLSLLFNSLQSVWTSFEHHEQ